jgi:hypothetical protein
MRSLKDIKDLRALKLADCIRLSRSCTIVYQGNTFEYEPYLIYFARNGFLYVHGYKTSGEYQTKPPPHWTNLAIDDISEIMPREPFSQPQSGYNPDSANFYEPIFGWKEEYAGV